MPAAGQASAAARTLARFLPILAAMALALCGDPWAVAAQETPKPGVPPLIPVAPPTGVAVPTMTPTPKPPTPTREPTATPEPTPTREPTATPAAPSTPLPDLFGPRAGVFSPPAGQAGQSVAEERPILTPDPTATRTRTERRAEEGEGTPTPAAGASRPLISPESAGAPRTGPVAGLFSYGILRPAASPGPPEVGALTVEMDELAMRGTSPAPRFSAFAAALARPAQPTWPRDPPPIEAAELDEFLAVRGSPMAGMGNTLLDVGWRYNIDPRLLVAIAGADTGFGQVLCTDFNAWNWFWFEWCNSPFESWRQALDEVARGLRIHYLDQGLSDVHSIANRYGPLDDPRDTLGLNRHWPGNVIRYLEGLGGSRCNLSWVPSSNRCPAPRSDPPPRSAPTEATAEEPGDEGDEAAEEPAPIEESAPRTGLPDLDELARSRELLVVPARTPTSAIARATEPRDDVGPTWAPPREKAALSTLETAAMSQRLVAAASVASPPIWTYLASTLVLVAIVAGRVLGTWRPPLRDPLELMLRRRAMRDEAEPGKLPAREEA